MNFLAKAAISVLIAATFLSIQPGLAAIETCFKPPVSYSCGGSPHKVVAADINGDSLPDLAVVHPFKDSVTVMTNSGGGAFSVTASFQVSDYPIGVCATDLNDDGKKEVVVVCDIGLDNVWVFPNLGFGVLGPAVVYSVNGWPSSVTATDMNGDGVPDLVIACEAGANVSLLFGDGTGNFITPATAYPAGEGPYDHSSVDLNGDQAPDVAVANIDADCVDVLINAGDGTLQPSISYPAGGSPVEIAAADVDSDGDMDLVVTNYTSGTVSVLLNNGSGEFASPLSYAAGGSPDGIGVGDFNFDDFQDIVVTNFNDDQVSILVNNGDGTFLAPTTQSTGSHPGSVYAVDLDDDLREDLVVTNLQSYDISVIKNCTVLPVLDTLWIGNPVCSIDPPYNVNYIPVYLANEDTVKGIDLPLEYDWDVDPIDISFEGTRLAGKPTLIGQIDTATKRIRIGWASFSANDVLEPATAATADVPIAKIIMPECKRRYFSAPDTATIQLPVNPVSLELSDKYGNRYVPFFVSDSTWIRSYVPGDANWDWLCTVSDAVYLINHIFVGGPAPNCLFAADADCNVIISISDVVGIINYIFAGGPVPGMNCLCPDSPPLARIGSIGAATVMTTSDLGQNAVVVATTAEMQALQLHFTATNDVTNVKVSCSDPRLQVFSGWVDGEYRVGLIDLTGKTTLPAGTHDLLTISYEGDGELVLKSAIVVDSDAEEMATTISSAKVQSVLPTEFALAQNRPNPFNPSTEISFSLPKPAEVTLVIYNVLGENVVTLAEGLRAAGTHAVMWDGRDKNGRAVASGVYFYRLDAGEFSATRKMLLLK